MKKSIQFTPSLFESESNEKETSDLEESDDEQLFQRIFKCKFCDSDFDKRHVLDRHTRQNHLRRRKRSNSAPYLESTLNTHWKKSRHEDPFISCDADVDCADDESEDSDKQENEMQNLWIPKWREDASLLQISANSSNKLQEEPTIVVFHQDQPATASKSLRFYKILVTALTKNKRQIQCTIQNIINKSGNETESSSDSSSKSYYLQMSVKCNTFRQDGKATTSQSCTDSPIMYPHTILEIPFGFNSMFSVNGHENGVDAIMELIAEEPVSCKVLDAYLHLLVHVYYHEKSFACRESTRIASKNQLSKSAVTFQLISVQFLYMLGSSKTSLRTNYKYTPKFTMDENTIVIAPLYICRHFYVAIINCYTKNIYVYDSCWEHETLESRAYQIKTLISMLFPTNYNNWTINFDLKSTKQIDCSSCSLYVAYYINNVLKLKSCQNRVPMTKNDLKNLRAHLLNSLLPTTASGSKLLKSITKDCSK